MDLRGVGERGKDCVDDFALANFQSVKNVAASNCGLDSDIGSEGLNEGVARGCGSSAGTSLLGKEFSKAKCVMSASLTTWFGSEMDGRATGESGLAKAE